MDEARKDGGYLASSLQYLRDTRRRRRRGRRRHGFSSRSIFGARNQEESGVNYTLLDLLLD